eukprot:CAMPEP_0206506696 /NCGR_PEP_ID=MMETSP0324_2-20121206/56951_1 /ASSEMBLY_ACC=CAM_ASM_000836 /TAXON_ID=2866 /ORGANISM="Crypthecodinium cohnii, Strain Seligo" /LENGTH=80 /DNA_ID=CAMNT_0053996539 /DNA_START=171 /DNA_END=410 /DNA_ORIENTATION=-
MASREGEWEEKVGDGVVEWRGGDGDGDGGQLRKWPRLGDIASVKTDSDPWCRMPWKWACRQQRVTPARKGHLSEDDTQCI